MKLGKEFLSFCLAGVVMLGIVLGFPTKAHAQQASFTNILVAIDAQEILEDYCRPTVNGGVIEWVDCKGTQARPQMVNTDFIHMLVKQDRAVSSQGGAELTISAAPSDVIRWSSTSFSNNSAYTVPLYKFRKIGGASDLLNNPQHLVTENCSAIPKSEGRQDIPACGRTGDVTYGGIEFRRQRQDGDFWQATVLATGRQTYTFDFTVLDQKGGSHGFYRWDPYIIISYR
ncbi:MULTISPECIES: AidA/PixA family protein [unclassified Moorena]|uniref:AidA/PixA family protein n=1 Tax=unclassified Moorena TaxID=2683338 RepID=UPI0013B8B32A|nr:MULTISPECIES: AidA/PixA family protein [unclassified Moorena]NER91156.1 hypothetical protein [Moorena sp. SIO3A2]NET65137.1 hypothetical protein [Moorena sp. SIO1G6]